MVRDGCARRRGDACTHASLLAFACECRDVSPSGHASRLAVWTQWLDATLLAPVPHRQVVLTIPRRLRAYCLYRRRLLGEIARVAHLLVTDGGFRPDGTFVTWPVQDTARLTEAFRRAVLRLFVRLTLFDEDQAGGMLTWPRSGFHVHTAVWVGPFGCRRMIARSRPASRATARGIPWRWNG